MKKKIYILVNGILNFPGDAKDWNALGVTFIHLAGAGMAEKLEYFCGPVSRAFGQDHRANKLADLIHQYADAGFEIVLVGHSNGCDVILDSLKQLMWPVVSELHLFSGACEADYNKNGLNKAIQEKTVGKVFVYVAGKDVWLRAANCFAGRLLGYGVLGLNGPLNATNIAATQVITEPDYGHSTWWEPMNFQRSLNRVLGE
jgi:hypothetical protein